MELLSFVRRIWLESNSKGTWLPQVGREMYVEELTDDHLKRIPHFIWKKHQRYTYDFIPDAIKDEIEERGMYIDFNDQCAVKYKSKPSLEAKTSKFNYAKKENKIEYFLNEEGHQYDKRGIYRGYKRKLFKG